jgi:competence protein ComEC
MQLEKPKLFPDKRIFILTLVTLAFVFVVRLFWEYESYQSFISKPFYFTYVTVIQSYQKIKNANAYQVLKVKSDEGLNFYTTLYEDQKLQHKRLRLQLFPDKQIHFTDYLGTFYIKSRIRQRDELRETAKDRLLKMVEAQHAKRELASFYNAIFFATPLESRLREKITLLGVNHLVALSGFHLGILWGLVYGILLLLYKPLQQRFFPYRYALIDIGSIAILFLGFYGWFVGFPDSLLRSYAMVLIGWIVLVLGMELLSFTFLTTVVMALIAVFPFLIVSLGFALSVAGVFYIFLLLQYAKEVNVKVITFILIPFGIFILMLPIVHTFFSETSYYQLLSPLLSVLFVPFYPVAMVLHLFEIGDVLDELLYLLFLSPQTSKEALLPFWMTAIYIGLSFGAIWFRKLFWVLIGVALLYMFYLFVFIQ